MINILNNKFFHLSNNKISYIFYVLENGHLGHVYYGEKLGTLCEADYRYMTDKSNKSAGTVKFLPGTNFSLMDTFQEYPVCGSTDFKESAIEITLDRTPIYLDFKFKDYSISKNKEKVHGMPMSYALDEESETISVSLIDENYNLELIENITIFKDSAVIARSAEIRNLSNSNFVLEKMLSASLDIPYADYEFIHLSGAWLKERRIKKHTLSQGIVSVESLRGASSHQQNPFIALQHKNASLSSGEVYGFNLIYSGNFIAQTEVDEWDNSRTMIGINPYHFGWQLKKGENFKTPEALICYSSKGMDGLSREFSHFIEEHIIDRKWKDSIRPIILNNWEATYFNFNHEKLLELAKKGAELGIECFVLDDGWFGKRDTDRVSLGDWYADPKKFPKGIGLFAQDIHNLGLKFGIWFEPEMVNPDSDLYRKHPEWVVRHEMPRVSIGRGQYVLDFANPEVIDNVYSQMKKIIEETNLDYIKWDMNRNITEAFSNYLKEKGHLQTEFFHRYILGVYELYERILNDFPDILIEGCASGGGRFDLGMLYYCPQIWVSDNTDAVERLKIQFGTSIAYPLSALSNHVSDVPNAQVSRVTPLKMRGDVAFFGPFGYELDINKISNEETEIIKNQINYYKKYRQLIMNGDFYKLISPFEGSGNEIAWAVVNKEKTEALVGFYRILAQPNGKANDYIKLPFLNCRKSYEIVEKGTVISGSILVKHGVRKPYQLNGANDATCELKGDYQSHIFHIEAK